MRGFLVLMVFGMLATSGCAARAPAGESMPPELKDGIRASIRGHLKKFTKCYDQSLKRKNGFSAGTVHIQWDINSVGAVEKAAVKQTSGDEQFDKCLVMTVEKIKFPTPTKDQLARVVYPIVFKDHKAAQPTATK